MWSTQVARDPNDDRSDSLNPNNPAQHASEANRANQLNPDHAAYPGRDTPAPAPEPPK
jgi:hypothetical protein